MNKLSYHLACLKIRLGSCRNSAMKEGGKHRTNVSQKAKSETSRSGTRKIER